MFVVLSCLSSFTSGGNPALHSLAAICLHALGYSDEAGALFGALGVLNSVAHIISVSPFSLDHDSLTTFAKLTPSLLYLVNSQRFMRQSMVPQLHLSHKLYLFWQRVFCLRSSCCYSGCGPHLPRHIPQRILTRSPIPQAESTLILLLTKMQGTRRHAWIRKK